MSARRAGGIRIAVRAALTAPAVSAVVVLLVGLVAFAGAALPALLDDARTATVQRALTGLRADLLDPTAALRGLPEIGPGSAGLGGLDGTWGRAVTQLHRIHDRVPQPLRGVLGDPQLYVTLDGTTAVADSARPANRVEVVLDPSYASRIRIVEGSLPQPAGDDGVVQVALSRDAARTLAWPVGERRTIDYPSGPMTVELAGVYAVRDAADPAWQHQRTGLHPDLEQSGSGDVIHLATAYAAPQLLPRIDPWTADAGTTAWLPLRPDRVDGAQAADVAAQLRGFTARSLPFAIHSVNWYRQLLTFRSSAPQVLEAGAGRGDAMTAIVALAAIGPLTVAIAAVAMTGRMLASRRVATVRLARARGASARRLAALLAGEGLALGALGAAAGVLAAGAVVGWAGPAALVVPALAAAASAAAVPVAALPAASRTARIDLGVADRPRRRRRLFVEGGIVLVAAAILVAAAGGASSGAGPVLVAAPVAVFALGCVVVLRLVPLAIRGLERLLARRRGVRALVGPARAGRGRTLPIVSVLASLVCVATALFAGIATATVAAGLQATARSQTGADLRLGAPQIGGDAITAVRGIPGVRAVAPVYADVQLPARGETQWLTVTVFAVDAAEFAAVQHDLPDPLPLPAVLGDSAGADVPAVASDDVVSSVGEGTLEIHGAAVRVVGSAPSLAFAANTRWIVVDRANAARLVGPASTVHTLLVDLDDRADAARVARAATAVLGDGAQAVVPARLAAKIAADPALQAVRLSLWGALAAVVLLLVLTASMTLLRGAPERGRALGLLAAMGYPRGRELPLVGWEVGPALLLALPVGVAAGFALPPLLLPAVDLTRFVGGAAQPPIVVAGWMPWAVAGGFVLIAALAVAVAAAVAARVTAATALRRIDEEVVT